MATRGRPSVYTPEIDQEICERLSAGESLASICKSDHLPPASTVRGWNVADKPPGFAARYARAMELGYDQLAEELMAVASDDSRDPQSRRVECDMKRWYLSKRMPKRYGDKVAVTGGTDPEDKPFEVIIRDYSAKPTKK